MSVILSTGGGSVYDVTSCLAGCLAVRLGGLCLGGFCPEGLCPGGGGFRPLGIRKVGGTHPTGTLSC